MMKGGYGLTHYFILVARSDLLIGVHSTMHLMISYTPIKVLQLLHNLDDTLVA